MRYLRATGNRRIGLATAIFLPALLSGCFFRTPVSNEPKHIGDVIEATGSPFVIRRNENYIIDVQSRIYEGDIIETDDTSKAQIEMTDRSMIRIGPGSHFVFNRYDYAPGASSPVARMTFTEGSVRIETRDIALARRPTFEVKTPFAVVGAGASDFWAGFIFAANTLDVATLAGNGIPFLPNRVILRNNS